MILGIFIVGIVVFLIGSAVEENSNKKKEQDRVEAERFIDDILRRYKQNNEYNKLP